jgi:peptidoglycan LD-endopeptidase CwlK
MDARSEKNLVGVHPDLVRVMRKAREKVPFIITCGVRTMEQQRALMAAGATRTLKSRHLTGHAVDVVALIGTEVRWDWPLYKKIADVVKSVATVERVAINWGGDWRTFKDGPHFQLDPITYP